MTSRDPEKTNQSEGQRGPDSILFM